MKIVCPECGSDFDVPLALLGAEGRRVRCASCRHVWLAGARPPEEAPLPPPVSPYTPSASPISATGYEIDFDFEPPPAKEVPSFHDFVREGAPKKKKMNVSLPGKTMLAAATLTAILVLGVVLTFRAPLASIMPSLEPVYAGLGLRVPLPAEGAGIDRLMLRPVHGEKGLDIEVSTKLLNLTDKNVDLSPLLIEMTDAQGQKTVAKWRFEPPQRTLHPEETVPFVQKVGPVEGDPETVQLRVRFVH